MSLEGLTSEVIIRLFRGAYRARRLEAGLRRLLTARAQGTHTFPPFRHPSMRHSTGRRPRNILFITVDQQRYDALGITGGTVARTPHLDTLGRTGITYRRAHVHNAVCMPSRATMLTGQHPHTHGVIANGIPLPLEAPSVAEHLRAAGYRTALIGKAHFEPHLDLTLRFFENRCAAQGRLDQPWRGFEHLELAGHSPANALHYTAWLWKYHKTVLNGFARVLTGLGGGETGAPEVAHNPIPRELYHTDWVAERTLAWLHALPAEQPWFCWMSFPDPHHPFDLPYAEVQRRFDWRDVPLPPGYPGSTERIESILARKPRHWLAWYRGEFRNPEGGSTRVIPAQLSPAQLREINAMIHVENELIDEACGRVFSWLREQGQDMWTDIIYTSDHGDLQGDFGLLFKGPYHTEALLRVPLLWRPAPAAGIPPAESHAPVGHVDLAPTFSAIAGLDAPEWMQGIAMPTCESDARRERLITSYDSQFAQVGLHLLTLYREGFLCTVYGPRTRTEGGHFPLLWPLWGQGSRTPEYAGTEGELYDLTNDPFQWENRWDDSAWRSLREDLVADLYDDLPPRRQPPLEVVAPT